MRVVGQKRCIEPPQVRRGSRSCLPFVRLRYSIHVSGVLGPFSLVFIRGRRCRFVSLRSLARKACPWEVRLLTQVACCSVRLAQTPLIATIRIGSLPSPRGAEGGGGVVRHFLPLPSVRNATGGLPQLQKLLSNLCGPFKSTPLITQELEARGFRSTCTRRGASSSPSYIPTEPLSH